MLYPWAVDGEPCGGFSWLLLGKRGKEKRLEAMMQREDRW